MTAQVTKAGFDLGIITHNGDEMLAFYRDVLGGRHEGTLDMSAGGIAAMHRIWFNDSLLKVNVPTNAEVPTGPGGGMMGATGMRYFTITVANLDEVIAACEAAGAKIRIASREVRPGVVIGMVEDPDGNWVEFIQAS